MSACPRLGWARQGPKGGSGGGRKGERSSPQPLLERGPTPIKIPQLRELLQDYPDRAVAWCLDEGFLLGFRIPAAPPTEPTWAQNLRSVLGLEEVVWQNIAKEISVGRVVGPFKIPPLPNLQVSPLGVVLGI